MFDASMTKNLNTCKPIFLFGIILSFFFSCKKDAPSSIKTIIEHDTIQHAWNEDPNTFLAVNKYYTNCAVNSGNVGFIGITGFPMSYDSVGLPLSYTWQLGYADSRLQNNPPLLTRTPINKNFAVQVCENVFTVIWPYDQSSNQTGFNKLFFFKNLDTSFQSVGDVVNSDVMVSTVQISDSGRIIIPVNTSGSGYSSFYLLDVKTSYAQQSIIGYDTAHFRKINIAASGGASAPQQHGTCGNIKNNLFVYCNNSTYVVRPDYSYAPVCNAYLASFFYFNNSYYAVGINDNGIYQTSDMGETWNKVFNLSNNLGFGIGIFNFDNKLISIYHDQLWETTLTGNNFTFKEIVNDGLTGKLITGIAKCNGVTFLSTNGGIFTRPYTAFYQYK
jgi:hypothetical protein